MTAEGLTPYPECRPSGLPWLGEIPVHWEVRRNARLFAERNQTGFPNLPILEVSIRTGVTVRDMDNQKRKQMMTDRSKYKRSVKGDIAYNMMRMWQGAVGVAPVDGLISPAYVVGRPLPEVDSRYYAYLFRTHAYMNEVNKYSRGIVTDRNRLYWDEFRQMPSVFPPVDEQTAIANHLDYNAALVSRFARTKRRQIEILNEQRTALAKALLAQATATCSLVRLRFICSKFGSGVTPRGGATNYVEAGVPFLRSQNVHFGELRLNDVAYIPLPIHESMSGTHVRSGDVLLNITGASIGRVCAVPSGLGEANVNQHVCIIRPIANSLDARYLAACLSLPSMQDEIYMSQNGASREGLPIERLKSFAVPLPSERQQRDLVKDLEAATAHITRAISAANSQIDLVRNFRTRLVADVVTGKLDVRSVPIELPEAPIGAIDAGEDMADETEPVLDEAEEVTVGDE